MKFIHIADLHLDSKCETLNAIEGLPQKRRLEQRQVLRTIIDKIKEKQIELLIIAGDLYEQNYIRRSSIDYINSLFEEIPKTQIIITPGNHDPYIKNSFYATYTWARNVHIFNQDVEKINFNGAHIYGMAFTDFYCLKSKIEEIKLEKPEDINLLVAHGTLDAAKDHYNHRDYNPIKKSTLEQIGFDYVALGHVHKPSYKDEPNQKICYSGSLLSLGFDEPGKHGYIEGEITKDNLQLEFISADPRQFEEIEIDITDLHSNEEIIEKIETLDLNDTNLYKIALTGKRFFIIDIAQIKKLRGNRNIVKIKDQTKIGMDITAIAQEQSVRGIFIKNMLEKIDKEGLDESYIEKAIEIGLEVLEWKLKT